MNKHLHALNELYCDAQGDRTEILADGAYGGHAVAVVPFLKGQSLEEHQALVHTLERAPKMAKLLERLTDVQTQDQYFAICDEARVLLDELDAAVAEDDGPVPG